MGSHRFVRLFAICIGLAVAGCSFAGGPASRTALSSSGAQARAVALAHGMHVEFGPYVGASSGRAGGWVSPSVRSGVTPIIYGSSYNGGFINIYALKGQNQTVIGQLTSNLVSPQGMVVDGQHHLWVANTNAGNIVAFQRGATTPFRILQDANEYPVAIAIDESGNVYAANAQTTSGGNGSVTMWARGHVKPTATLTSSDFILCLGIGVDPTGDVFVTYIGQMGPAVDEFPKGSQTAQPVNIGGFSISDIIFDDSANLIMSDNEGGVGFWPSPYQGGPERHIPAFGNEPTFNVAESKLWVALANANTPEMNEYDVSTGALVDTISNGFNANAWPFGVAIDPRASLSN